MTSLLPHSSPCSSPFPVDHTTLPFPPPPWRLTPSAGARQPSTTPPHPHTPSTPVKHPTSSPSALTHTHQPHTSPPSPGCQFHELRLVHFLQHLVQQLGEAGGLAVVIANSLGGTRERMGEQGVRDEGSSQHWGLELGAAYTRHYPKHGTQSTAHWKPPPPHASPHLDVDQLVDGDEAS